MLHKIMRIKLTKNHRLGKSGDIVDVSNNVGFGLIDSGYGKVTKDMTSDDYKQAGGSYEVRKTTGSQRQRKTKTESVSIDDTNTEEIRSPKTTN